MTPLLRPTIFILLALLVVVPVAQAQANTTLEDIELRLVGLESQVANVTQLASTTDANLLAVLNHLNASLANLVASAAASNASTVAQFAEVKASMATLTAATNKLSAAVSAQADALALMRADVAAIKSGQDTAYANLTSDHVKLFVGTHITNKQDPNYGKPAYVALSENQRGLSQSIMAGRNETADNHATAVASLSALTTATADGFRNSNEQSQEVLDQAADTRAAAKKAALYAGVCVLFLIGFGAYVFGPKVLSQIKSRKGSTRYESDPGLEPEYGGYEVEVDAADELPPAETPPAPTRRRPRFGGA